tara:strand:+ start:1366 stop:1599 length:234 start_codon:yes stop_codon:yes gene_type:complete
MINVGLVMSLLDCGVVTIKNKNLKNGCTLITASVMAVMGEYSPVIWALVLLNLVVCMWWYRDKADVIQEEINTEDNR